MTAETAAGPAGAAGAAAGDYCRGVESYLCRRNDGHLIRIVGPAFELVRGWEARRVPLRVVFRAIDRTVARREAAGNRRPARIEFCAADVDEAFDEWRRAVGVAGGVPASAASDPRRPRRRSLASHLDHAALALTRARTGAGVRRPPALDALAARTAAELDALRPAAKTARGAARRRLLARLDELDRALTAAARETADPALRETVRREAAHDLAPFRGRMPPDAFRQSLEAGADRLLRERLDLPRIAFEQGGGGGR